MLRGEDKKYKYKLAARCRCVFGTKVLHRPLLLLLLIFWLFYLQLPEASNPPCQLERVRKWFAYGSTCSESRALARWTGAATGRARLAAKASTLATAPEARVMPTGAVNQNNHTCATLLTCEPALKIRFAASNQNTGQYNYFLLSMVAPVVHDLSSFILCSLSCKGPAAFAATSPKRKIGIYS